jgi:anti-sigma factor (TIGR02949 family)
MPDPTTEVDCLTAVRQLWDYLDEELSDERMAAVSRHLERCRKCLPHHDFSRRFLEALHETRKERVMPPDLKDRVMERLAEAGFVGE